MNAGLRQIEIKSGITGLKKKLFEHVKLLLSRKSQASSILLCSNMCIKHTLEYQTFFHFSKNGE